MIFCHPQAHFFHRKISPNNTEHLSSCAVAVVKSIDSNQIMGVSGVDNNSSSSNSNSNSSSSNSVYINNRGEDSNSSICYDDNTHVTNNNDNRKNNGFAEIINNNSNGCNVISESSSGLFHHTDQSTENTLSTYDLINQRAQRDFHEEISFVSSYFIGLSFCNLNFKSADVTPSVLDFMYRVNMYDGKKESMKITVNVSTCPVVMYMLSVYAIQVVVYRFIYFLIIILYASFLLSFNVIFNHLIFFISFHFISFYFILFYFIYSKPLLPEEIPEFVFEIPARMTNTQENRKGKFLIFSGMKLSPFLSLCDSSMLCFCLPSVVLQ